MNAIESQAAQALLNIATAEHRYLSESAVHDGFVLTSIATSDVTDEMFDAWFSLTLDGQTAYFRFTLGHDDCDADTARYQPKVEVTGGPDDEPLQYDRRFAAGTPVGEEGLLDAVLQFGRECGEARVLLFRWLEQEAPRARESSHHFTTQ